MFAKARLDEWHGMPSWHPIELLPQRRAREFISQPQGLKLDPVNHGAIGVGSVCQNLSNEPACTLLRARTFDRFRVKTLFACSFAATGPLVFRRIALEAGKSLSFVCTQDSMYCSDINRTNRTSRSCTRKAHPESVIRWTILDQPSAAIILLFIAAVASEKVIHGPRPR